MTKETDSALDSWVVPQPDVQSDDSTQIEEGSLSNEISALHIDNENWKTTANWCLNHLDELHLEIEYMTYGHSAFNSRSLCRYESKNQPGNPYVFYRDVGRLLIPFDPTDLDKKDFLAFSNKLERLKLMEDTCSDSIAYDLLFFTGFESKNIHFAPDPNIEMDYNGVKIKCSASYGVFRKISKLIHMLVLEDITGSRSIEDLEVQLAGDMLIAVMNHYRFQKQFHYTSKEQMVYGMIMLKSYVKFYIGSFPTTYLEVLDSGDNMDGSLRGIVRSDSTKRMTNLNIYNQYDREVIVEILTVIKHDIEMGK
ncbi:hypothetical protein Unana1_03081 [Umbelopsis nana]